MVHVVNLRLSQTKESLINQKTPMQCLQDQILSPEEALQDPQGALQSICDLGETLDLPVTVEEVKDYLAKMDDQDTKQWLIKARGGL